MSIIVNRHITFIDSLRFYTGSLNTLASNLNNEDFKHLTSEFGIDKLKILKKMFGIHLILILPKIFIIIA